MYTRRILACLLLALGVAHSQEPSASIQIAGAVQTPLTLTAADLAKMPRASVKQTSHGRETSYAGVWLHEVLKRAGAPQGSALRGKALAGYILATARDGYQVVFSLGELDPSFVDNEILVADTADGKSLSGELGPFRLVVSKDQIAARSLRMLTKLEIVQLRR